MIDVVSAFVVDALGTLDRASSWRTIGFGLLSSVGMAISLAGAGLFDAWPLIGRWVARAAGALNPAASLDEERVRMLGARGGARDLTAGTLLERAVGPLALWLATRAPRDEFVEIERAYDLLGRDKSAVDFYARRVLATLTGVCVGILFALALSGDRALPGALIPAFFAIGFYKLPALEIRRDLKRRGEQMLFEMPHMIDRLLVNVMAHRNIADGIKHTVVDGDAGARAALIERLSGELSPEQTRVFLLRHAINTVGMGGGGFFARELMQVYAENLKNGDLKAALLRMAARNAEVSLAARFAERLAMSYESGASLIAALTDIGARANEVVENMIQTRGEQNLQAMIVPSAIALAGVFAAIGAPAITSIFEAL
jgi:hypothetical protein